MADYKDIHGGTIQNFAGDPPAPINGQIWYDSTNSTFQYQSISTAGSWASGGALNAARAEHGTTGTQTASLVVAGSPGTKVNVEQYDGSAWTEIADISTGRYDIRCAGTTTAAIAYGGRTAAPADTGNTESWDGSSWTEVSNLNTARNAFVGDGANDSAMAVGGETGGSPTPNSESWDGSSWTEGSNLNRSTGRKIASGAGASNTAFLFFGGHVPATVALCESWNGSSWTEVGDLNSARRGMAGLGTYTAALCAGGSGATAQTEQWNGTSWTEVNDLSLARNNFGGCGTTTAGLAAGGGSPGTGCEEWNSPSSTTKQITEE